MYFFYLFLVILQLLLQHEETKFLKGQRERLQQQKNANLHSIWNQVSPDLQSDNMLLDHSCLKQSREIVDRKEGKASIKLVMKELPSAVSKSRYLIELQTSHPQELK